MKIGNVCVFVLSRVDLGLFSLQLSFHKGLLYNERFPLLTFSNIPNLEVGQTFYRIYKNLCFLSFSVSSCDFSHSQNCNYLLMKDYCKTISHLDEHFHHSNPRSLSNFDKNCIKIFKVEKCRIFVIFGSASLRQ